MAPPKRFPTLSDNTLQSLVNGFKMLADRSRLRILLALAREGELNVTSLCDLLQESQPAVSHHLHLLRKRKFVRFRREGKNNYYSLDGSHTCDLLSEVFLTLNGEQDTMEIGCFLLTHKAP